MDRRLFEQEPGTDLARWSPLLPPLEAPTLGEGGTPLVEFDGIYVKDESRNPTWSHKDRLNRVAVSAAVASGAPGVVVASSGNHGASAAAYAARAGLPAIVLTSADSPWKGFVELRLLGLAEAVPRMFSCETAAGGPHARALATGAPAAIVTLGASDAYGIAGPVGGHRGVVAVRDSGGEALLVTDEELRAAQRDLAGQGLWQELSGAAGLAGYRKLRRDFDGPVVCVATSSGFKDVGVGTERFPALENPTLHDLAPDA